MTTTNTPLTTVPVTTPAGSRIPLVGTLCYHDCIGFATVVARSGSRVRIRIDDFSEASDVTLNAGTPEETSISREAWLARCSESSLNSAIIEVAGLEARLADAEDAFHGATTFVKEQCSRIEARVRDVNEMVVGIDGAEAIGWEFDEYATYTPKKNITKGKAPKPRAPKPVPSNVGTIEDASKPDWLVAEMNECFGEYWTPAADGAQAVDGDDKPSA